MPEICFWDDGPEHRGAGILPVVSRQLSFSSDFGMSQGEGK
jgi:hypothetical protein